MGNKKKAVPLCRSSCFTKRRHDKGRDTNSQPKRENAGNP